MSTSKLVPNDPRVESKFAELNGIKYHYLLGTPEGTPRATIFLIHGWPDFSFGWRNQIPLLVSLGLRVVAPDMMGYAKSSAPESASYYTYKRAADDVAALAAHLETPHIIVLGHDWGGAIVYRIALWYPKLVTAVLSISTPFMRPTKQFIPTEYLVKTVLPNFTYQIQLASGEVEEKIKTKAQIREFVNAMYGGWTEDGLVGFVPLKGILYDNLPKLNPNRLLSAEEVDHYAENYAINGLGPTLNWYRTRELNFKDEEELAKIEDLKITVPTLFVVTLKDTAIPPEMSKGMEGSFTDLTRKEVEAGHWALVEKTAECNAFISEFLEDFLAGGKGKAVL